MYTGQSTVLRNMLWKRVLTFLQKYSLWARKKRHLHCFRCFSACELKAITYSYIPNWDNISSLSSDIKYLSPSKRTVSPAGGSHATRKFAQETRERGSHLAQQRVRKMRKLYAVSSSQETREVSLLCMLHWFSTWERMVIYWQDPATFSATQDVEHSTDFLKDTDEKLDLGDIDLEEGTEEQDALELYQWSQDLSYEDLG